MPPPLFCMGWHNRPAPPPPRFKVRHIVHPPGVVFWYCGVHVRPYRRMNARDGVKAAWIIEEIK